ncbi:MAG: helix-turn-helix transcriptional regulator [Spirochaetota bacterium]
MQHVVFLLLALSYTAGLASLMLTLARYLARHDVTSRRGIVFMASATASVISITLNYYMTLIGGFPSNPIMLYVTDIGLAIIVFALPAYAHSLSGFAYARIADKVCALFSAFVCLLITASYFFPNAVSMLMWLPPFVLGLTVLYTAGIGIAHILIGARGDVFAQRLFTAALVGGILIWLLLELVQPIKNALGDIPSAVVALVAFYFLASSLLLFAGIRGIMHTRSAPIAEAAARYGLTSREAQIIEMLASGESYKAIADVFGITMPTVKTHVSKIYEKTGVRSKSALVHKFARSEAAH